MFKPAKKYKKKVALIDPNKVKVRVAAKLRK